MRVSYKSVDDLPLTLGAMDISKALGYRGPVRTTC